MFLRCVSCTGKKSSQHTSNGPSYDNIYLQQMCVCVEERDTDMLSTAVYVMHSTSQRSTSPILRICDCHGRWKSCFYRKHVDFWELHAEGSHVCSHPPIYLALTDQVHVEYCGDLKSATEWVLGPYPCDLPSGAKPQWHLLMFYFLKIRFHCVA
jgi:hypothetical protein